MNTPFPIGELVRVTHDPLTTDVETEELVSVEALNEYAPTVGQGGTVTSDFDAYGDVWVKFTNEYGHRYEVPLSPACLDLA